MLMAARVETLASSKSGRMGVRTYMAMELLQLLGVLLGMLLLRS